MRSSPQLILVTAVLALACGIAAAIVALRVLLTVLGA